MPCAGGRSGTCGAIKLSRCPWPIQPDHMARNTISTASESCNVMTRKELSLSIAPSQ